MVMAVVVAVVMVVAAVVKVAAVEVGQVLVCGAGRAACVAQPDGTSRTSALFYVCR